MENGEKAVAVVQVDKCIGCGVCVDACPQNAIKMNNHAIVDPELCTACAICVSECPTDAITIK